MLMIILIIKIYTKNDKNGSISFDLDILYSYNNNNIIL